MICCTTEKRKERRSRLDQKQEAAVAAAAAAAAAAQRSAAAAAASPGDTERGHHRKPITSLRDGGAPKPAEHVCREKRTGFSKDWRVLPAGTDSIVHRGMYDAVGFVRLQK